MKISFLKNDRKRGFKELYETYYAPFCLYAKRFIDDLETREDIVSEVFISLWEKKNDFNFQSATTLSYIKTCVKNKCLNYLRHKEYESNYAEMLQKRTPIYEEQPDSVYTLTEMYAMLDETLKKLPENYRAVFLKSTFEGKTQSEIAEELNLNVKSINRYKKKTVELLRSELKEYFPILIITIMPSLF